MDAGSAIATGLILGLSSGGHCFWACTSVMGPYLIATQTEPDPRRWSTVQATLRALGWYNLGRLLAYLGVGLAVTWLSPEGAALPLGLQAGALLVSALVLGLAVALPAPPCPAPRRRHLGAVTMGLLQGLSPCPPFVAAVGLGVVSPGAAVLLFLSLFVGTGLFTLPLALLEPLRRQRWLTWLARAAGAGVAIYLVVRAIDLLREAVS